MNSSTCRLGRAAVGAAVLLAIVALPGCGGTDGGGTIPMSVTASFAASGTGAAPNAVRLRALSVSGDRVVVEAALGGPTTSGDLYSFAFDLVLSDPTIAAFLSGTATAGTALVPSGAQTLSVQAAASGNRVIVGATKLGAGAGNGVAAGEAVIVRLTFQLLKVGTTTLTFSGAVSAQNPTGGPAALDSTGALIPSVQFDASAASLSGT